MLRCIPPGVLGGFRASRGKAGAGDLLQLVAERPVVAPLESAFLALALASLDEVLQASRADRCGLPAFGATLVPLHAQLIFALPRNGQLSELIFDPCSHSSGLVADVNVK